MPAVLWVVVLALGDGTEQEDLDGIERSDDLIDDERHSLARRSAVVSAEVVHGVLDSHAPGGLSGADSPLPGPLKI